MLDHQRCLIAIQEVAVFYLDRAPVLAAGQGRACKQVQNIMAPTGTLAIQRVLSHSDAWTCSSLKKGKTGWIMENWILSFLVFTFPASVSDFLDKAAVP